MYYAVWISYCALVCEKYVVFLTTIEQTPGVRKRLSPVQKPLVGYEAQPDLYHSSPLLFQLLPYNPIPLQNAPFWKTRKKKSAQSSLSNDNLRTPKGLLRSNWNSPNRKNTETSLKKKKRNRVTLRAENLNFTQRLSCNSFVISWLEAKPNYQLNFLNLSSSLSLRSKQLKHPNPDAYI